MDLFPPCHGHCTKHLHEFNPSVCVSLPVQQQGSCPKPGAAKKDIGISFKSTHAPHGTCGERLKMIGCVHCERGSASTLIRFVPSNMPNSQACVANQNSVDFSIRNKDVNRPTSPVGAYRFSKNPPHPMPTHSLPPIQCGSTEGISTSILLQTLFVVVDSNLCPQPPYVWKSVRLVAVPCIAANSPVLKVLVRRSDL